MFYVFVIYPAILSLTLSCRNIPRINTEYSHLARIGIDPPSSAEISPGKDYDALKVLYRTTGESQFLTKLTVVIKDSKVQVTDLSFEPGTYTFNIQLLKGAEVVAEASDSDTRCPFKTMELLAGVTSTLELALCSKKGEVVPAKTASLNIRPKIISVSREDEESDQRFQFDEPTFSLQENLIFSVYVTNKQTESAFCDLTAEAHSGSGATLEKQSLLYVSDEISPDETVKLLAKFSPKLAQANVAYVQLNAKCKDEASFQKIASFKVE
jgi:hypothetical protein